MKLCSLIAVGLGLAIAFAVSLPARATVVFTNDAVIQSFDTNYDGADVVVSNCTLTVNGAHSFLNLLVATNGTLTHTFSSSGTVSIPRSFVDEAVILNGTNAVSLVNTGFVVGPPIVTDVGKTVTYTNDLDYLFTFPASGIVLLQRATNSTIPDGGTVLVSYTVEVSTPSGLNLNVTNSVQVAIGGAIRVDEKGYGGNVGIGNGGETLSSPFSGGGAGYGGGGGSSSSNAFGGTTYGSFTQPTDLGSGGGLGSGSGGAGGGAVRIVAGGDVVIDGMISANGAGGIASRSGGGSGGSIWLTAHSISGIGTLTANGGAGEPIHGGGGGGGRIALYADTNDFTGSITTYGSGSGTQRGGAGTTYTKLTGQAGELVLDNGDLGGAGTLLQVTDGANVTVRGRAIGFASTSQSMGKLLVNSNSVITSSSVSPTIIITAGNITVEPTGRIMADGLGQQFGSGAGTGILIGSGIYYGGGGGHGGAGGMGTGPLARGGNAFGSTANPTSFGGSGGGSGSSFAPFGGRGGGAIRLTVSGNLIVNGTISSDGKSGTGSFAGGGAGGSVLLLLVNLSGSGSISANGGPGNLPAGGGGGGGRIAITYATNSFSGAITAYGGAGTNIGGAGTIYLRSILQSIGQVTIDNGGNTGTNTMVDLLPSIDLTIAGKANLIFTSTSWSVRNLVIKSNNVLSPTMSGTQPSVVTIAALGNVTVEPGGAISLDGLGSVGGQGTGGGFTTTSGVRGGAGHGGFGGANPGTGSAGSAYGNITAPITAGSGGGNGSGSTFGPLGGNGGGGLSLIVAGTLTVNGRISTDARNGDLNSGGGSGGSLNLSCNTLLGSGTISANGGAGDVNAGGGAGGRIAIGYVTNGYSGTLSCAGGSGLVGGGAGTIYTKVQNAPTGELLVNNNGLTGTNTPLSSTLLLPPAPFNLTIGGGAAAVPITPLPLLSNLTVAAGGVLTTLSSQTNLNVSVIKNVHIAATGGLIVNGKGFGRGVGPGPGLSVSNKGSGGGYGGIGGASGAGVPGGTNYGSAAQPVDRGSGGGAGFGPPFPGSEGGGAIRLTVGGTLNVDGSLSADGNAGLQDDSGGGAGGSIWVVARTVSGGGLISANGGAGELFGGGGGGGGRIAIYSRSNSFTGTFTATGGIGATAGGNGSLLWSTNLPSVQGTITNSNGQPVSGVTLLVSGGNPSVSSGVDGKYEVSLVPYTSFSITPNFSDFTFVPGSRSYPALLTLATNQDYLMASTIAATMTSSLQDTNFTLSWPGISGVTYQTYYSTNLFDWLPYGGPITGSNGVMGVAVPIGTDPTKFFRVRASN